MGYSMGYICQERWDIFEKPRGILGKTIGYIMRHKWK